MTVADKSIPVVPDIGTEKAARLAAQRTGKPGRWVRLDCQHTRHVQQPVEAGQLLECPTCPPSRGGALARRRVLHPPPERHLVVRFAADPLAPSKAGRVAAEAVAAAGPKALLGDVERVVGELVAAAIRHTQAPVELTVDTHDDVVRVEVRDQGSTVPVSAGSLAGSGTVVWCELRAHHGRQG
jgi:signal transduction histidine kinase